MNKNILRHIIVIAILAFISTFLFPPGLSLGIGFLIQIVIAIVLHALLIPYMSE